jgi:hypothetical protein
MISSSLCSSTTFKRMSIPYLKKRLLQTVPQETQYNSGLEVRKSKLSAMYVKTAEIPTAITRNIHMASQSSNLHGSNARTIMASPTSMGDSIPASPHVSRVASGDVGDGWGGDKNGGICDRGFTLTWCSLIDTCCDAYFAHGPDCSEKSYVDKIFYKLYELGVPAIRERPLFATENGVSISRGRVDLEIASKFLLEFKIIEPSPNNVKKDRRQLLRYLNTYHEMGRPMQRAALVYFYSGEVRIINVSLT